MSSDARRHRKAGKVQNPPLGYMTDKSDFDYQHLLEGIYYDILPYSGDGEQADYIPALARVNPDQFGMCLKLVDGREFSVRQADTPFSIQSISKVFALAMAMSLKGESIWKRVGKEPSGTAFNSLVQLESERGFPRNPFINAGAIVIADVLLSSLPDADSSFLSFVRSICGNTSVSYDFEVAQSERASGFLNAAIANLLKHHGRISNDIEEVLGFYFRICSVNMSCRDLARAFLAFTNVKPFEYGGFSLTSSQIKRLNAVMQTCGFYDEAGEFSYLVGLPGKSGVGGGIVADCPGRYSVAVWSPRLNGKGNSVLGMKALELLTTRTEESIF